MLHSESDNVVALRMLTAFDGRSLEERGADGDKVRLGKDLGNPSGDTESLYLTIVNSAT